MPKVCKHSGCTYNVFGGGYCRNHQYLRTDKKPKPIKQFSAKRQVVNLEYNREAKKFREENPACRVNTSGCTRETTEVHHKKGRGKYLMDKTTWLPVCHNCHCVVEENPNWAKQNGYSSNRL